MEELISVIVPVYNVEKYIAQCVESIINQKYNNLEIILVDDGSLDSSRVICDNLAAEDKRVRVVHKENGGLSDARNYGISIARGKYLSFIDSDDFVSNDFIASLYDSLVRHNADIACCGFNRYYTDKNIVNDQIQGIDELFTSKEAIKLLNIYGYFSDSACNKLFEKSLFDDISFPVGKLFEDTMVMIQIFDRANLIYYNSDPKYYYRQRQGSIVTTPQNAKKQIDAAIYVKEYIASNHPDLSSFANQRLFGTYVFYYNTLLINNRERKELSRVRSELKRIEKEMTYEGLKVIKRIQYGLLLHIPLVYNLIYTGYKS